MNSATKSFYLSVPLGNCLLIVCGALHAGDRTADPVVSRSITKAQIDVRNIVDPSVHLANVDRGDSIVAYVDGKPVSSQSGHEPCCRIIKVEGLVAPGVHKLAVRTVGCPGSCSITSNPSNEIKFHYYDQDVYLLRPGAGCDNKRPNQDCLPTPNSTSGIRPTKGEVAVAQNLLDSEGIDRPQFSAEDGHRAAQLAAVAASNAQPADRVSEMDAATERAWDEAAEQAAYEAAGVRFNTAKSDTDENGVRRAHESAQAAQTQAAQEWNKAASRIAEGEASASRARAQKVTGPPSPFVFASAAHFPIREFGPRGELADREGVVIYEDMTLSFDKEGSYQVRFVLSTPALPVKLRMQLQIQPHTGGPWYTITLPPLDFPPDEDRDGTVRGTLKDHVHNGHSEILRRCYGEMGRDARIRRHGTARVGFGVNVP